MRHPLLRPGVRVTRRDQRHLQVGLDPGLVLDDSPEARELLADLSAGRPVARSARLTPAWRRLVERGLLVDGETLRADLPADPAAAGAVAATYATLGTAAHEVVRRRASRRVAVEAPEPLSGQAEELLRRSGVGTRVDDAAPPYAVLLVTLGVIDRALVDVLVQADVPHLVVACLGDRVQVGPFVLPGLTACLRCADATLADQDPRRGLVVDQYARGGARCADGVPTPLDPATAAAATAWAVRDLVTHLDDGLPTTWSATVALGPGMSQTRTEWRRHPGCGCAWQAAG